MGEHIWVKFYIKLFYLKGILRKKYLLYKYKHMYKCTCMCIYSQRHMHRIDRVTLKAEMLYKNWK